MTMPGRGPLLVSAISIACLVMAFGWKVGEWHRATPTPVNLPFQNDATRPAQQVLDSDGDGLPDWQEELIGSNQSVADPDPEQLLTAFQLLHPNASTTLDTTVTGSVGVQIASEINALKASGAYTPEKGLALADSILNKVADSSIFRPYSEDSFAPTVPPTPENIRAYTTSMHTALQPLQEMADPDFVLFAKYVSSGNPESLETMRARAIIYSSIARSLMLIRAPRDIATDHQRLANALLYFQSVTSQLAQHADDPIATLALIRAYNEAERYLGEQLWIVDQYLNMQ